VWDIDWVPLDDETAIAQLCRLRGVGRWTAEMFLMFHLLRPDVLPLDDLGIVAGMRLAYGEALESAELREIGAVWRPWRSVAAWYLWRSLDPEPVEY
jgi:DNA-3-methyladenine glycosylase II